MRKIFAILTILCATVFSSLASQKDSLWNAAVNRYMNMEYDAALADFLALEQQGYASAELFYNIGNCYYKQGHQLGKVILYYERSLKADPSFEDARFNLDIAREATLDKIDVVPEFILVTWVRAFRNIMSSNAWMVTFVLLFAVTAVLVLLFRFAGRLGVRKLSFSLAIVTLLLSIMSLLFALSSRKVALSEDKAVVTVPVTSVKGSPGNSDQSLFILHEGTVLEVIDAVGEWRRVEIADGRQGWLEAKNIEII